MAWEYGPRTIGRWSWGSGPGTMGPGQLAQDREPQWDRGPGAIGLGLWGRDRGPRDHGPRTVGPGGLRTVGPGLWAQDHGPEPWPKGTGPQALDHEPGLLKKHDSATLFIVFE